jgi:hypothetical protein
LASRHSLSERALHEYVAEVEGHQSQVTGIVGYFYAMYRAEVLARVQGIRGRDILEVGCGEGMMFDGTTTAPVQMDVSLTRVGRAVGKCRLLLCADETYGRQDERQHTRHAALRDRGGTILSQKTDPMFQECVLSPDLHTIFAET